MGRMTVSQLKSGIIFGDLNNGEYVYVPAGEIGLSDPLCRFETKTTTTDVNLDEAVQLIERYGLKPVVHPKWGRSSC